MQDGEGCSRAITAVLGSCQASSCRARSPAQPFRLQDRPVGGKMLRMIHEMSPSGTDRLDCRSVPGGDIRSGEIPLPVVGRVGSTKCCGDCPNELGEIFGQHAEPVAAEPEIREQTDPLGDDDKDRIPNIVEGLTGTDI